jgi:hypothetical protein
MKNLCTTVLCLGMVLFANSSKAQNQTIPINEPDYNKPKLFNSYPAEIPLSVDVMNSLLGVSSGATIDKNLAESGNFRFSGTVISATRKYGNTIISVVIRSTNFIGARLTLSRIVNQDGTITYTGRIISKQNGDLYELKNVAGRYTLVKRNYYDLVNE